MKKIALFFLFCLASFGANPIPATVTSLKAYDTISDLVQFGNPLLERSAFVRGYSTSGDGGGGMFVVTNTIASTNLGTRFKSAFGTSLSWERMRDNGIFYIISDYTGAYTNNTVQATNGNTIYYALGYHRFTSGQGAIQIESAPGTSVVYINLYDSTASTNKSQIRGNAGHISMAPAPGRTFRVRDYLGTTTWLSVNEATGLLSLFGSGITNNAVLYVDGSGNVTSSTVPSTDLRFLKSLGYVNVMEARFGADNTGLTDTTVAIRSAITAAGTNTTLIFPKGTYLLSGALRPLAGQRWLGFGAKLKRCDEVTEDFSTAIPTVTYPNTITVASTNGFLVGMDVTVFNGSSFDTSTHRILSMTATTITIDSDFTTAFPSGGTLVSAFPIISSAYSRITFDGFEVDGNRAGNTSLPRWQLHQDVSSYGDNCIIRNIWVHDSPSEGIYFGGINPSVSHCVVEDTGGNGIHLSGTRHPTISYTTVRRCNLAGTTPGHADGCIIESNLVGDLKIDHCWVEDGLSGVGSLDYYGNSDVTVTDTTFTNFTSNAIISYMQGQDTARLTFNGNKFYNAGTVLFQSIATPPSTNGPKSIVFDGNTLMNTRIVAQLTKGLSMSGNIFTNTTATETNVLVIDSRDFTIRGGVIEGGGHGVQVTSNVSGNGTNNANISIQGVTFRNQFTNSISFAKTGMKNASAIGNHIYAETNKVDTSWIGISLSDGATAEENHIYADDGLYGIQAGTGASGYSKIFRNEVITRSGMATIQALSGSSNAYIEFNFVSSAVVDSGSANYIGFNPIRGEPLRTGTGIGVGSVSPAITNLTVYGSESHAVVVGSAVTLGTTQNYYLCNVDAQTVTLPTAVSVAGRIYTIKLLTPATTGTVATTSSQKIDGATTYSLTASNKFVSVISNGTNWWITGAN